MTTLKRALGIAMVTGAMGLAACAGMSEEDRMALQQAQSEASEARAAAERAANSAERAEQSAASAAQSAADAAASAERAERMFSQGMRK